MSFTTADLMRKASTILNDGTAVRWTLTELLDWINAGLVEIAILKPTATSTTLSVSLASGTKQAVPAGYHQILRVIANTTSGKAIGAAQRENIDIQIPGWHANTKLPFTTDAAYFINEGDDQGTFYVVPGNDGTGSIEVVASAIPAAIPRPSDPLDISEYTAVVPVGDIYQNVMLDYILYRAFSKDIAVAGAANRAVSHYQQFTSALGVKSQIETVKTPDAPQGRFSS